MPKLDAFRLDQYKIDRGFSIGTLEAGTGINALKATSNIAITAIGSYGKVLEAKMLYGGVITVNFALLVNQEGGNNETYARIYKNGVAVGTARTKSSGTSEIYTENITVSPNDLVQIYAYKSHNLSTSYILAGDIMQVKLGIPIVEQTV